MSAIQIRAPKNTGNKYCGPAAISAITGIGTAEAATVIRSVTGQKFVKSSSYSGCTGALNKLGYRTDNVKTWSMNGKRITLAKWLKLTKEMRSAGRVFLVCSTDHWFVISGRRYVCGITKEVVSIRHPDVKRRARIARAYEVIKTGEPTFDFGKAKPKPNNERRQAQALAKKIGVELDKHWTNVAGEYWVDKPSWLSEEDDPYYDGHLAFDWADVLERVQAYEKIWLDRGAETAQAA